MVACEYLKRRDSLSSIFAECVNSSSKALRTNLDSCTNKEILHFQKQNLLAAVLGGLQFYANGFTLNMPSCLRCLKKGFYS